MTERNLHLHDGKKGAALAVRVTPRASRNEISEVFSDGTVKIHLTAPPVDGKANEALLKFLASVLEVPIRIWMWWLERTVGIKSFPSWIWIQPPSIRRSWRISADRCLLRRTKSMKLLVAAVHFILEPIEYSGYFIFECVQPGCAHSKTGFFNLKDSYKIYSWSQSLR